MTSAPDFEAAAQQLVFTADAPQRRAPSSGRLRTPARAGSDARPASVLAGSLPRAQSGSRVGGHAPTAAGARWHRNGDELQVEVLEKPENGDYIRFRLNHADYALANALRRICIAEVPMIAVDLVEVFVNDSVLHDEMLVHRVGLVPLQTFVEDPSGRRVNIADRLIDPRDCACDSTCSKCSITFDINVRCEEQRRSVTSRDIINVMEPTDPGYGVNPVHAPHSRDEYPIVVVELSRHQEVRLRCIARRGIGKEHAKWNPTCTVAMQHVPDITLNEAAFAELAQHDKERWVRYCPRRVYAYDGVTHSVSVSAQNVNRCFFCNECVAVADEPFDRYRGQKQLTSVKRKRDALGRYDYIFKVETTGTMTPAECTLLAIKVLSRKLTTMRDSVSALLKAEGRDDEAEADSDDGDDASVHSAAISGHEVPAFARAQYSQQDVTGAVPWC